MACELDSIRQMGRFFPHPLRDLNRDWSTYPPNDYRLISPYSALISGGVR